MTKRARRRLRITALVLVLSAVLPMAVVLPWRWLDPPTSAFMLRAWIEGIEVEQQWVDIEEITPHLPIAVVAAEDQRFPEHHGFDVDSIQSVLRDERGRPRGASTISQQVAKNLFLWRERSWFRKAVEAGLTVLIEVLWPKRRILEIYLNIAEFGPGVYGAEAAAGRFFGKPAARLNERQSALLAAVLPNPARFSAVEPSGYVEQRVGWILRQVRQLGGPAYLDGI